MLPVLAAAERSLADNAIARRADISPNAALRALNERRRDIVSVPPPRDPCSVHILDPEHHFVPPLQLAVRMSTPFGPDVTGRARQPTWAAVRHLPGINLLLAVIVVAQEAVEHHEADDKNRPIRHQVRRVGHPDAVANER